MFIHFYLVDVCHFQNHIVVCIFLGSFLAPPNLCKCSTGTDQTMLFQVKAAGTALSINYRTEKDTDHRQKRH